MTSDQNAESAVRNTIVRLMHDLDAKLRVAPSPGRARQ
jgi:hypothetical protein